MRLKFVFITVQLALCMAVLAQAQQKLFTIAEATNGMATTLAVKNIKAPMWQPGTNRFWQIDNDQWKVTDYEGDMTNKEYTIPQGIYPLDAKLTAPPALKWITTNTAYFVNGSSVVTGTLNINSFSWELTATLPAGAENIMVMKGNKIAYTVENNVYYFDKRQGHIKVSNESNKNIVCGKPVHRDEFGIDKGIFWSPEGTLLAYYRMDQTMVKDYPVVKWDAIPARADLVKYPMAGDTSHQVTLVVYNPSNGNSVTLRTGEKHKDHYLTCVTWSPDEKYIYIGILSRAQNHLLLNQYDVATGEKVKTLFEEFSKKYVHPTHPLTFLPGSNDRFIWQSEKDGYNHLYVYNIDGKQLNQVTKGEWVVNELLGFNKDEGEVIFTASKESPLEKHIYKAALNGGSAVDRIDAGAGMHGALITDDGKYIYDAYQGEGTPRNCYIRAVNGNFSTQILKAPNPLAEYNRPEIRNITLTAADNTTKLYGRLILPIGFDSTKKYPVIVYLYNGPNVQLLHNAFPESGNLWYEYMAQQGYIVFCMEGRGSWNRGLAFEQATYCKLGEVEMADQMQGVEYLKKQKYVDGKRMGLHGWSYGGFMTTSLMLKYPGTFACAVAGGPVLDWRMYEVMYTERYMQTPQENPDGYKKAALMDKVKNLQGKLMLIHGTSDDVVVWQHSLAFLKKCVDEGVQVDYFVYPGHEHNVRGKDRVHLMQKITDYFNLYLK
ncbi:MAG: S9 family peptidase [Chitinophagia bacterium]|nr:S9 family peptidase [Chitinophagia bacterium]